MTEEYEVRLKKRLRQVQMLGEAVCAAMEAELQKIGFKQSAPLAKQFSQAVFELTKDPYDGQESLKGAWRNAQGRSIGMVVFYPDGTFYAEYDIVRPHPHKKNWFVEAMTAWGRGTRVVAEARLLPALMVE